MYTCRWATGAPIRYAEQEERAIEVHRLELSLWNEEKRKRRFSNRWIPDKEIRAENLEVLAGWESFRPPPANTIFIACRNLFAQEELKGSLFYEDGTPGRVSYVDMAIKGRPGMKMYRAISRPPYRQEIVITQNDIDYALKHVSLDGTITRDDDGNVIIVISATHRRVITPSGEITEVFENPDEFSAFFFNYTSKYPRVVKATDSKGGKKAYLAVRLKKGALNRVYMRVNEVRATEQFLRQLPGATYLENVQDGKKLQVSMKANIHPVENGYFSFIQGVSGSNFNNTINVYQEQVHRMESKQDVSSITASEMDKIFDGSLLNAEIIVGKGNAISTSTYEKMK